MTSATAVRTSMTSAEFRTAFEEGRTDFRNVTVKGNLSLDGVTVVDDLDLEDVTVEGNLSLVLTIVRSCLDLNRVTVKGNLSLVSVKVQGFLSLAGVTVEGDLYLTDAEVKGDIHCGDNLALALQCFLHFGGRVQLDTKAAQQVVAALMAPQLTL